MNASSVTRHQSFVTRLWRLLAIAAVALIALSACAPVGDGAEGDDATGSTGDNASEPGTEDADTGEPVAGGTLRIGTTAVIETLHPWPRNVQTPFLRNIYDYLLDLDEQGEPQPLLAESWTLADDGLSLEIVLRDDVVFHDGTPLTAAHVVESLEWTQDPANRSQLAGSLAGLVFEELDDATLRIVFPGPYPQVFGVLEALPILDVSSDIETAPNATGPFMLESFQGGNSLSMVRNDDYWGEAAHLDGIDVRIVPNASALALALESGDIDFASGLEFGQLEGLDSQSGLKVETFPGSGNFDYLLSAAEGPTSDVRVRNALDLALDRQRFVDLVLQGYGEARYVPWAPTSPAYDEAQDEGTFDLERAREQLEEAGYADGLDIQLTSVEGFPASDFNEIYQADLAEIGVNAEIVSVDFPAWNQMIAESSFNGIVIHGHSFAESDPALLFAAHPFGPETNASNFESAEYAELVAQGESTYDIDARLATYSELTEIIQEEDFYLPLAGVVITVGLNQNVQGVHLDPHGSLYGQEVWLSE